MDYDYTPRWASVAGWFDQPELLTLPIGKVEFPVSELSEIEEEAWRDKGGRSPLQIVMGMARKKLALERARKEALALHKARKAKG